MGNRVADRLAMALDPVRYARRAGIVPDDWQRGLLRANARQTILLCSRQSGKSTICATLAAHEAEYRPGSLVLLLSPSLRQSGELYRKLRTIRLALGDDACPVVEESALRLELANGSRVVCLPGREQTIRGFSNVALLIEDEASRVDDLLYEAIRPMLAVSGGRIVLLSTPFGERGHFWKEWVDGGPDWHRARVPADQCPRIPAAWLEAERARIGSWSFRQEYAVEFMQATDQVFAPALLRGAVSDDVQPLFGDWKVSDDVL
jgi:hypothetical protein